MTPSHAECLRTDRSIERIYRRHVGDVYRYSLAVLREPTDAVDVTQTTFANASSALQRGDRPGNARHWLIGIAHDVCRRRSLQAAAEVAEDLWGEDGPTAGDIRRALSRLTFDQRAALVLREFEGRSYREVAEALGLSRSEVETLLFHARRALREQLEASLTCTQAERAISRRADTRLPRAEREALRVHLRECDACSRFAAGEEAQRRAFAALASAPVPRSLTTLSTLPSGALVSFGVAQRQANSIQDNPDRKIFRRPASH
jgi:RNA polymerase sigma-70 factor (ECF subfamily)